MLEKLRTIQGSSGSGGSVLLQDSSNATHVKIGIIYFLMGFCSLLINALQPVFSRQTDRLRMLS